MIVDCHGHYTTAPEGLWAWRKSQLSSLKNSSAEPKISDQEILDKYLSESQSVQEAFKLFGFNLADSSSVDTESPPVAVAATP